MSLKFGTSGLRGLSVDLEGPATALYATAFARYLLAAGLARQGDEILIGRDFRASSPAISAIAIAALGKAGLSPRDCGALPTPALALLGLCRKAACLMVTGSHIPADRNGIKFYRPDGEIDKADEAAITAAAAAIRAEGLAFDAAQETADDLHDAAMALYTARNRALLPEQALAGLRIGVYQHSTVARDLFVSVLAHYGADVVALGRSESFIPVDTEAVSSETIALLQGWAVQHGLAAIVSADGDGDRPLVTDETGTPLRGDLVGLIASRFLGATAIATPVTSNSGIEAAVSGTVLRTRVGSPFVIAAMNEAVAAGETAVAGFEANGGTLTATPFTVNGHALVALPTRDSLLPVLAVLTLAAAQSRPLSEIAAGFALPAAASDRLE
ncbi:MAG TPA: phosphomannomutase, partial [Shinella sp.]|nr:phosphomannomutase [Shinella sp.]